MKLLLIVGARPNFIKVAPIVRAIQKFKNIEYKIVHTGQHYDRIMSDVFFKGLDIPDPDVNFEMKSSTHAALGMMMSLFEHYCLREKPDVVVVFGDIDSTLACALVVSKLESIKLVHIEAGERSFDRTMPEEVNRVVTDVLSDCLFCTNKTAVLNLTDEGIDVSKIFLVGNVMVDNLLYNLPLTKKVEERIPSFPYALLTIHRQSNTDNKKNLETILDIIEELMKKIEVIFPMHPRTISRIKSFGLCDHPGYLNRFCPQSYLEFLAYMRKATVVLTDSGGIQVETSVLNIPCLTLRENTEHLSTLTEGTNTLVGVNKGRVLEEVTRILRDKKNKISKHDPLWDGKVSERIVDILDREVESQ